MKNKLFIAIILSLFSQIGQSQTTESRHKLYIPFWIGAGYGYEWSKTDEITINFGFDMRAYVGDDDFAMDNFVFSPRINLEPRYFYNLEKRAQKGKNINFNSANFFSIDMSYELPFGFYGVRDFPQSTIRILPTWGIRRELFDHLTMDFSIYAGYKLKKEGDSNPDSGNWDSKDWSTHKFAFGFNLIFSRIF